MAVYNKFAYILVICLLSDAARALQQFQLGGVIRDQAAASTKDCTKGDDGKPNNENCCGSPGTANGGGGFPGIDFQIPMSDYKDGLTSGLVDKKIGADRTPVCIDFNNSIRSQESFYTFFHNSPKGFNVPYNVTLTQKMEGSNVFTFNSGQESYGSNIGFFPVDGRGWKDYCNIFGHNHNFGFCLELHTLFGYQGGEEFFFSGDDDFWLFINDDLVIDLGCTHPRANATIKLDELGLVKTKNYRMDIFYCERRTWGSNLAISTSMELVCPYYDWCGNCVGDGQTCCTDALLKQYCDDNNACTTDKCGIMNAPGQPGGCVHEQISCPKARDQCTLSWCDSKLGCTTAPKVCDDADPCTTDSCDPKSGCQFKYACEDGDMCTTDTCTPTGCQRNKTVCDDGKKCTDNLCNSKTGCSFPKLKCGDPTNSCQTATCDEVNGCVVTPIPSQNCLCKNVTCNSTDPCHPKVCKSGECVSTDYDCDDGNPCSVDVCSLDTTGKPTCSYIQKLCSNNTCAPATCNRTTGQCVATPDSVTCSDGNPCTIDTLVCNAPNNATCVSTFNESSICDDKDMCTNDMCNASMVRGAFCSHSNVTCTPGICQTQLPCSKTLGCQFIDKICPDTNDWCIVSTCDVVAGCINTTRVCPVADAGCYIGVCDSVAKQCTQAKRDNFGSLSGKNGIICPLLYDKAAKAGAISAGAIAGAVIGGVAAAGLLGFGGKKGYDYYMSNKDQKMTGVKGNPLYEETQSTKNNPMYAN